MNTGSPNALNAQNLSFAQSAAIRATTGMITTAWRIEIRANIES